MSLTSMLDKNEKFKEMIKEIMPSKTDFITNTGIEPFSNKSPMLVDYQLENSYKSSLVGTAADYLFRFMIARVINKNKENALNNMAAEKGLQMLKDSLYSELSLVENSEKAIVIKEHILRLEDYYEKFIGAFRKYIYGEKDFSDVLICIVVWFAQLEHYFRSKNPEARLTAYRMDREFDVEAEVKKVVDVFAEVFIKSGFVTSESKVVFNPHFGEWSKKIGGADADIFIDDTLYDFKCVKTVRYNWNYIAQVYGYYLLYLLDRRGECKSELANVEVRKIAIYFGRHGLINLCDISKSCANNSVTVVDKVGELIDIDFKEKEDERNALKTIVGVIDTVFPQFKSEYLDKNIYGSTNVDLYLSAAYPPYVTPSYCISNQSPIFWKGNIPDIVHIEKRFYVVRINVSFVIKPNQEPFVCNKTSRLYPKYKPLETSDVYNERTKSFHSKYYVDGEPVDARLRITLTKEDFELFNQRYIIRKIEFLAGCYF